MLKFSNLLSFTYFILMLKEIITTFPNGKAYGILVSYFSLGNTETVSYFVSYI